MSVDELVALSTARIGAFAQGDATGVLDEQAPVDAADLLRQATAAGGGIAIEVARVVALLHWCRYQALPEGRDQDDLQAALGLFTAIAEVDRQGIPEPVLAYLDRNTSDSTGPSAQAERAADLLRQVLRIHDSAALNYAVDLLNSAIDATPDNHPDLGGYLSNLGLALRLRYERTGDPDDLDGAVAAGRRSVQAAPDGDPDLGGYLSNLGLALYVRHERTGAIGDLDDAVTAGRQAVHAAPDGDPDLGEYLSNLGGALRLRYERTGDPGDLDDAVATDRQAVDAAPEDHPGLARYLSNLGVALQALYKRTGALAHLDDAVTVGRQSVDAASDSDSNLARYLSNLGVALQARYERSGDPGDLHDAVAVSREAVRTTPDGDPNLAMHLSNLSNALRVRYERTGIQGDLDDALAAGRQAVDAAPDDDTGRAGYLSNLGGALQVRYERTGASGDLDDAVAVFRRAVHTAPDGHPHLGGYLSNLGNALRVRYERTGAIGDLDDAVTAGRQAVDAAPDDDPGRAGYLSNLGLASRLRYERTGAIGDLDDAVTAGRQAVDATPEDHPDLATYLSSLGSALQVRYGRTGAPGDPDDAVVVIRQAVDATPDDHPALAGRLSNLGNALRLRYERTAAPGDLDDAVTTGHQAVHATPGDHPDLAMYLSNLGLALQARYRRTGDTVDLDGAVRSWERAVATETAPAGDRLKSARLWAETTAQAHGPAAATPVYTTAIGLLPLLAWRGISRSDQRHLLNTEARSLGRDAAACALAAGLPDLAVELVEQGRGVLWAQLLDTRTDLTALQRHHPDLAAALADSRAVMDQFLGDDTPALAGDPGQAVDHATRTVDARMAAARTFDAIVARVRALPPMSGFPHPDSFLRPPALDTLLPGSGDGPVVIINISQWRCDALILTHHGVTVYELSGLTEDTVTDIANRYLDALQDFERGARRHADRLLLEMAITAALEWLWDHITAPILQHLGHTTTPDGDWPRLWWCPTGPLTVLPLHAAGHHTTRDTVCDRVISSYTPTLRALTHARGPTVPTTRHGMLIAALPHTPGHAALPAAETEVELLSAVFTPNHRTVLAHHTATRHAIIRELGHHQWFHASCHGTQTLADPAAGGLVPHDWDTNGLVGITDLTPHHTGGQFAFLSACKTATGGVTSLDEAITIAAAMHHAGWQHVIGTIWTIWDDAALTITASIYPQLVTDDVLDPTHSAHALHQATRELRNAHPHQPSAWAPFIHTGP
jgi:tetratricopeptide (TPR) repeat protein